MTQGEPVGKRHRRIRARSATGQVAGAATEKPGLEAHRPKRPAQPAFSQKAPRPSQPTLSPPPDTTGPSRSSFMPEREVIRVRSVAEQGIAANDCRVPTVPNCRSMSRNLVQPRRVADRRRKVTKVGRRLPQCPTLPRFHRRARPPRERLLQGQADRHHRRRSGARRHPRLPPLCARNGRLSGSVPPVRPRRSNSVSFGGSRRSSWKSVRAGDDVTSPRSDRREIDQERALLVAAQEDRRRRRGDRHDDQRRQ